MTNEIWKPISNKLYWRGVNQNYEVSNYGRIRNTKTGNFVKPFTKNNGKLMWTMHDRHSYANDGSYDNTLQFLVDQTVYVTFTDSNDSYGRCIKHRDGDKLNNAFENLYI